MWALAQMTKMPGRSQWSLLVVPARMSMMVCNVSTPKRIVTSQGRSVIKGKTAKEAVIVSAMAQVKGNRGRAINRYIKATIARHIVTRNNKMPLKPSSEYNP